VRFAHLPAILCVDRCAHVSFGTNFWPTTRPSLITTLVTFFLNVSPQIPFVWATAALQGKMEPELVKKVEDSGRGIIVDWAPQVKVLRHEAVGMFMVSCRNSFFLEICLQGTPDSASALIELQCLMFCLDPRRRRLDHRSHRHWSTHRHPPLLRRPTIPLCALYVLPHRKLTSP